MHKKFFLKRQNSPSPFTTQTAPTSSMRLILATSFARWTWTLRMRLLKRWAARRRRAKRKWSWTNSCLSSASAKRIRNRDVTRTSSSVWSCTTNRKMEWCLAQNCLTHFYHLVRFPLFHQQLFTTYKKRQLKFASLVLLCVIILHKYNLVSKIDICVQLYYKQ